MSWFFVAIRDETAMSVCVFVLFILNYSRDEQKRRREEDLLSDDEFEKEINEMCSDTDDDGNVDDIDEDDLLMELEEMIGSN